MLLVVRSMNSHIHTRPSSKKVVYRQPGTEPILYSQFQQFVKAQRARKHKKLRVVTVTTTIIRGMNSQIHMRASSTKSGIPPTEQLFTHHCTSL